MSFCLPIDKAKAFAQGLIKGDIDPQKLASFPDSASRREFLSKYVGEENAKEVNALIESKLLLKNQEAGLINASKKLLGETTPAARDSISRIQRMDKILNATDLQSFKADLASKKLGTDVSFEEAQKITQLSKAVSDAKANGASNFAGISDEYLKARNEMSSYVDSLKPISSKAAIGKYLTIIGRNNLLLAPSTLLKTSIGQFINSATELLTRRISTMSLTGDNGDLSSAANKEAWNTFKTTGVNVAGMESVSDMRNSQMGGEQFGTTAGQSKGAFESGIRTVAKISNKLAIDWQHITPFTKVYQKAFYDMTNILSSDIAKREGLLGDEAKTRSGAILTDAAKIEPQTTEGKMVRSRSQEQAARVTSTNETWASHFSLGMKKLLNKISAPAGFGLGDMIMPIAKIPATIFANGLENAGVGFITGGKDFISGWKNLQSENIATRYDGMIQFQKGLQTISRTAGTIGFSIFLRRQFKDKDLREDPYGNRFVRLGNTWINTEYMSAISPALGGVFNWNPKKNIPDNIYNYATGASSGYKSLPGVDEIKQLGSSLMGKGIPGALDYGKTFLTERGVPQAIRDMFKDRPINRLFFGGTGVETTQQVSKDAEARAKKAAETRRQNALNK